MQKTCWFAMEWSLSSCFHWHQYLSLLVLNSPTRGREEMALQNYSCWIEWSPSMGCWKEDRLETDPQNRYRSAELVPMWIISTNRGTDPTWGLVLLWIRQVWTRTTIRTVTSLEYCWTIHRWRLIEAKVCEYVDDCCTLPIQKQQTAGLTKEYFDHITILVAFDGIPVAFVFFRQPLLR